MARAADIRERTQRRSYDAVVVGAGPNGLAAAIVIAQAGRSVLLLERSSQIGGGLRSSALTLPGFVHDICSAVFPLGIASPFFRTLPLPQLGLEWIQPAVPLAHPFADGSAALLERSVEATAERLGRDGPAYQRLMGPLARSWEELLGDTLGPLRLPRHPFITGRFGLHALRSIEGLVRSRFDGTPARALLAGIATHAMLPPDSLGSAAFALMLGLCGHAVGWPLARGGAQRVTAALAAHRAALGGEILVDAEVQSLDELPPAAVILCDVTPRQLVHIGGPRLSSRYRRKLQAFRYGPGVFKIDWALSGPIPWRAAECASAGTVHLVGGLDELTAAEGAVARGAIAERPFVLLSQPSLFDDSRAPAGSHTAWAYCHVPHGSAVDMQAAIEDQLERFAPGFRELVLARHTMNAQELEAHDPNYVGGDIGGGVADLRQLFTRPAGLIDPYATSDPGLFLCSASTPPGGGVHGMCGYHAAQPALQRIEHVMMQRVRSRSMATAEKRSPPQVVAVTGASAGVGRAVVRAFAARGAHLGLIARGEEGLEAARREVEAAGGRAVVQLADVADPEQVEAAAARIEAELGPIEVWVNNAMVSVFSPVKEMTAAEYRRVTEVTYLGYVHGTLSALRRMLPRNRGLIVQVGSALSYRAIPLQSAYCAAKHAIKGFTESLRSELLHDRSAVAVTMVQLPAVNTPQFDWVRSRLRKRAQPVPPIFQPELIADAIVWASEKKPRELCIGWPVLKALWAEKLVPGLVDRYLARRGYDAQQTDEPADPEAPDNLFQPLPGDAGARGRFDARARTFSLELWLSRHRA